jgi:NAD(P)-dependent dehydrogenase (short-subunit alcohol dehydrogenase family)
VQTDVTDAGQVAGLVAATLERHGRIDALVNNAGASLHDTTIEQLDLGEFHQVLDLNLVSVIRLMQAVLPSTRRQAFGRIVNISSGTTGMVLPGIGAYAATKSAVNMLAGVVVAAAAAVLEPAHPNAYQDRSPRFRPVAQPRGGFVLCGPLRRAGQVSVSGRKPMRSD